MAKHKKAPAPAADSQPKEKLSRKEYESELARLHVELVKLQQWVVHKGLKVCIVFEGRDGAGKGGTIKALTDRVSPRINWKFAIDTFLEGYHIPHLHRKTIAPYFIGNCGTFDSAGRHGRMCVPRTTWRSSRVPTSR